MQRGLAEHRRLLPGKPRMLPPSACRPNGRPGALTSAWATSTRKPSTPRSSQKRRIRSNSAWTAGLSQLKSGWEESKRCRYHWPGLAVRLGVRVQAGPPKWDSQLLGGSSPSSPCPSRKMNMSRSGLPGAARQRGFEEACSLEQWLGTRSTMTFSPSSRAVHQASKSVRVPKSGSTSQ